MYIRTHTYIHTYIHIFVYVPMYFFIHTYAPPDKDTCTNCLLPTAVTYELLTSSRHLLTQVSVPEYTQNMLLVAVLVWVVLVSVHLMTLIASRAVVRLRAGSCDPSKLACTPA